MGEPEAHSRSEGMPSFISPESQRRRENLKCRNCNKRQGNKGKYSLTHKDADKCTVGRSRGVKGKKYDCNYQKKKSAPKQRRGRCPECDGAGRFLPEACGCDLDDSDAGCPECTCDRCDGKGTIKATAASKQSWGAWFGKKVGYTRRLAEDDVTHRRLAEDNVNSLTAFCAWALMLLIVVVVYTLTKMGKRSAMQRRHLSKTQVAF